MTDILIHGINGKMGKAVYAAAAERRDFNVVCGVDKRPLGNFCCPVYTSLGEVNEHVDCIIDFSSPNATGGVIDFALENECALLIATTGHSAAKLAEIERASKCLPVFLASNLSLGIDAVSRALPVMKEILSGFDVTITEAHRKIKKDRPSGTALKLKNILGGADVVSVRGGDIPGTHTVMFFGENEVVSVSHTVYSRDVFAKRALDIGAELIKRPNGLYTE